MARIKALCLDDPCSGNLRMVSYLALGVIPISHDRVHKFRRPMGLRAIHQKPHTISGRSTRTLPLPGGAQTDPISRSGLSDRQHVHPTPERFRLLLAVLDLFSGHVLSWRPSNRLDTTFCLKAMERALECNRKLDLLHSEQRLSMSLDRFRGQTAR